MWVSFSCDPASCIWACGWEAAWRRHTLYLLPHPYPEVTAQGRHPGGGQESPVSAEALAVPTAAILPPAQPTLWPHQMPSSPLNPAGLVTAEPPHPVLSSGRPLPCPFKKPLYATSGHPPWGAAAVALSSAWRRGQPSPIFSQHLSQFATSVYVSVASKNRFSRGDGFVFTSAPDTQLKAWPHRVPAESLLQTEQMGRWLVGWKA